MEVVSRHNWTYCEQPRKTSVGTLDGLTEIPCEDLPKTNLQRYRYCNPIGQSQWVCEDPPTKRNRGNYQVQSLCIVQDGNIGMIFRRMSLYLLVYKTQQCHMNSRTAKAGQFYSPLQVYLRISDHNGRAKTRTVFGRSDIGIVGSNPTRDINTFIAVCCVFGERRCDRPIPRPRSPTNCLYDS
jgi:hypothetical protein